MLYRIRAYALIQLGDLGAAETAIEESIRLARESGRAFELASSLEAASRLWKRLDRDPEPFSAEAGGLLSGLGVVATQAAPLPALT